jgi:hypothetical protein
MTAKVNHATPATSCPAPVVLFGIDSHGKPKGARFGKDQADLAIKAASQLQLRVLASNDPKVAGLATQLPVGRVHATGRTFVPFIRRDLYDKLVAAAPNGNAHPASPPASGSSDAAGAKPPGSSSPNLPKTWQEISLGDLVVAQEGPEDGWYEAIVAEVNGDMLTLRWRDYPPRSDPKHHRLGRARKSSRCRLIEWALDKAPQHRRIAYYVNAYNVAEFGSGSAAQPSCGFSGSSEGNT